MILLSTKTARLLLTMGAATSILGVAACARRPTTNSQGAQTSGESKAESIDKEVNTMSKPTYQKPSEADLAKRLTPLQYEVTQHEKTEPPFRNTYWNNHEHGLYVDVVTGEPLFTSMDKFESGTGWPSFTKPVAPERVVTRQDTSFGVRTEVRSRSGNSHLGHVFDDGPAPTGLRYCINSASLRFIPVDQLEQEGYGDYRALFASSGGPTPHRP